MRRMGTTLLLAGTLLTVPGCTASSLTGISGELAGTWEWVQSEGGLFPQVRTPETEGIEREVTFLATGTVRVVENGQLVAETTWEAGAGAVGTQHEGRAVIRYGDPVIGFEEQAVSLPDDDTLILDDGCCDAFVHTYRRVGS